MPENTNRLTKQVVDAAGPKAERYIVWDSELRGFGVRVETSGTKTYLVRYRPKGISEAPKRFVTIGRHGVLTPEQARDNARSVLGAVASGADPARDRAAGKDKPTLQTLFVDYMRLHVDPKLKPSTAKMYRYVFDRYMLPKYGERRAEELGKADLLKLHADLADKHATGNRILNYVGALYSWAGENEFITPGYNPAATITRYSETKRERYLSVAELLRLGEAIREAETTGIPWEVDIGGKNAKHAPTETPHRTPISPQAAGALRLLLFTGARLREILNLRWEWVDLERSALFLPDSKTGKKTIYLNAPAMAVLESLPRIGAYVFPGEPEKGRVGAGSRRKEQPRSDLKRPWDGVRRIAGLSDLRIHDLRHTHASFGVGGGLGLPVIAKLLGHAQIRTTERYSHLDADPIRLASESIARRIADAMGEGSGRSLQPPESKKHSNG